MGKPAPPKLSGEIRGRERESRAYGRAVGGTMTSSLHHSLYPGSQYEAILHFIERAQYMLMSMCLHP